MQVILQMQEVREFTDEVGELQLQRVCNVYNEWRGPEGRYKSTSTFEFRLKCARTELKGRMLRRVTELVFVRMRCMW